MTGGLSRIIAAVANAWCAATRVENEPILAPTWQGEPAPANIIATQELSGHGDILCGVRYLPLLSRAGYRPSFRCARPGFRRLLEYSFRDEPSSPFLPGLVELNYQIPLGYLPALVFNGRIIPRKVAAHENVLRKPYGRFKPYVTCRAVTCTPNRGGWTITASACRQMRSAYVGQVVFIRNRGLCADCNRSKLCRCGTWNLFIRGIPACRYK